MVIGIVIIAAVTCVIITALVCSVITIRPKRPCLFDHSTVLVGEYRIGDGSDCSGRVDNVYITIAPRLKSINDSRVCDRHLELFLDLRDNLLRQDRSE